MKNLILALMFVYSGAVLAADNPDWAYPVTPPPPPLDSVTLKSLPGSTKQYTQAQIDDPFNPPDWYPNDHPPMPPIVANGGPKPAGRACAQCHLTSGDGHPESSNLAGLPAAYIVRQMAEYRDGNRKGVRAAVMIAMSKVLSDAEVKAAADYFASLKPAAGFNKVVETDTVAKSFVGAGGMRFATPDGGREPIGNRIIVLPQDEEKAKLRDPRSGFIDYVPTGSMQLVPTTAGDDMSEPKPGSTERETDRIEAFSDGVFAIVHALRRIVDNRLDPGYLRRMTVQYGGSVALYLGAVLLSLIDFRWGLGAA
jgi:cytochrome c553